MTTHFVILGGAQSKNLRVLRAHVRRILGDAKAQRFTAALKKLLLAGVDRFNAAFVEKLATFALRRVMTIDDRAALAGLAKQSKAADYRRPAIIETLILSELFQKR